MEYYINNKTKDVYKIIGLCTDCTNSRNGTLMMMYRRADESNGIAVRELNEFYSKFTYVKLSMMQRIYYSVKSLF